MEKLSDVILVVPPCTIINTPNLGVHLLQAEATKHDIDVSVIYADIILAKMIGMGKYRYISETLVSQYELIQERLFSKVAYPNEMPFLGKRVSIKGMEYESPRSEHNIGIDWEELFSLEKIIEKWVEFTATEIIKANAPIVGFSISHQQTNAAIALINKVKSLNNNILIVVGGSNCDGIMSKGILSLSPNIDYVFSGRSEISFVSFLTDYKKNQLPNDRIIYSKELQKIDDLPIPNYDDYFSQIKNAGLKESDFWVNIESSRGCWWGYNNQCKFCGVNGSTIEYKAKSSERVFQEISTLKEQYSVSNIRMVDTLMPKNYFKTLLPKLADKNLNIFYEQRANLIFNEFALLKEAGVNSIQIGIESFSSNQLNALNKGVSVAENISSLRFCCICEISIGWNLLYDIPNDEKKDWESLLSILPSLTHLPPPCYFRPVELARFSPYFNAPAEYNITNLKYFDVYKDIYPQNSDIENLAWLFTGDYPCASKTHKSIINTINGFIQKWITDYNDAEKRKYLTVLNNDNEYLLIDTRTFDNPKLQLINKEEASVIILGAKSRHIDKYKKWAIDNNLLLNVDERLIPLAICSFDFYKLLNEEI